MSLLAHNWSRSWRPCRRPSIVLSKRWSLTDDSDGEGALPAVAGQVGGPNLDQRRPDLELGGRRQGRNAHHARTVAGVVCEGQQEFFIYFPNRRLIFRKFLENL